MSTETTRQKHLRHTQEVTFYRVQEDLGGRAYRVVKRVMDVETDIYHVTIKDDDIWCDCPGFRRQKFALERHKHIRVVRDYIKRGCPTWAEYNFRGSGKTTKIKFARSSDD